MTSISAPFNVDLTCRRCRCHCLHHRRCRAITAVATGRLPPPRMLFLLLSLPSVG
jgi:hypothetical protein